jgi:hypothetical protein
MGDDEVCGMEQPNAVGEDSGMDLAINLSQNFLGF